MFISVQICQSISCLIPEEICPSKVTVQLCVTIIHCCPLYVGLPAQRLGCLDRVSCTAHRTHHQIRTNLWLHARRAAMAPLQCIAYRIAALVWRCLLGFVPTYFRKFYCPTAGDQCRRSLRSTERDVLLVLFARSLHQLGRTA